MSRSQPTGAASPATRFFEWSAEKGQLQYYDKQAEGNVPVKLPFSYLILDEVSQVGGGAKVNGKYEGYWSNAVKNLNTQIITVKSRNGVVAQGLYADLKERKGLSYIKGLYIAFYGENNDLQIGYLKLKGSSLGAWFDFTKSHRDIYKGAFTIKGKSEPIAGQNGDYYHPVFAHKLDVSAEADAEAIELDKQLQEYFKSYFAQSGTIDDSEPQFAGPQTQRDERQDQGGFNPATDQDDYDDSIPF